MIQISQEMAQQLVEFVSGETGYSMIVCNTDGVIIGDSRKERFGVRHEGAVRIMRGEVTSIAVTREEAERSGGTMREGYNIEIKMDRERIGTFGIGGPVEIVKPIAKISAAVIAARIQEIRHLDLIRNVVAEISRSVQQTAAAIEKIYAGSEELNEASNTVAQAVSEADAKVKDMNKVLEFILDVADETRLLGLNAAIVAAQAREHGRGFSVVADEIRKLAKKSSSSVEQITETLEQIHSGIAEVRVISGKTAAISEDQLHSTEQITRDIENIQNSVNTLVASMERKGAFRERSEL
jgi:sugar diacid utilization regulator